MPRSSNKKTPPAPRVVSGDAVSFPVKTPKRPQVSVGVTNVRRSKQANVPMQRRIRGFTAAEASERFPKGGAAFQMWVERTHGIDPGERRTAAEWAELVEEFASRPIHGHRRGRAGGNHRVNKHHRR